MSENEIDELRSRFAREAMALMERTGEEVSRARLAAELGVARARVDSVFPGDGDLFEAITAEWFAPKLRVMDEVMASDLPPPRKMYEFFARRFRLLEQNFRDDPATFNLYVEMGERYFEYARSYIDLGDHYLCELIAEAQADGYLEGLEVDTAMSIINQMVNCYLQPYMIAMIDDRIGQVLAKLDALGLSDDTVVIFTTDHGDFMGDHQLLLKAALHYQGLVRVPFIWDDPDVDDGGSVRDDLSGTLDIAATVLDRAGLTSHNGNQGRSLLTPADGDVPMVIEEHQRRGYMGFEHGFRARTLMGRRYRMTIYEDPNGFGELYDLDDDPGEQNNLFEDPAHSATRHALAEELVQRLIGLTDTSPLATNHGP